MAGRTIRIIFYCLLCFLQSFNSFSAVAFRTEPNLRKATEKYRTFRERRHAPFPFELSKKIRSAGDEVYYWYIWRRCRWVEVANVAIWLNGRRYFNHLINIYSKPQSLLVKLFLVLSSSCFVIMDNHLMVSMFHLYLCFNYSSYNALQTTITIFVFFRNHRCT